MGTLKKVVVVHHEEGCLAYQTFATREEAIAYVEDIRETTDSATECFIIQQTDGMFHLEALEWEL